MASTTPDASAASETAVVEAAVRDFAAKVIALVDTRRTHPTYGVGKTQIRSAVDRMEGALGVLLVVSGVALNPMSGISDHDLLDALPAVATRVLAAREAVRGI